MATGQNLFSKAVKEIKGNQFNAALAAMTALNTEGGKFKKLWEGIKVYAFYRFVPVIASMTLGLNALRGAFRSMAKESGGLEAALNKLSRMNNLTRQFESIIRNADQAKRRMAELARFTNSSKGLFNLEQSAGANKSLEILTKGSFSGSDAMEKIGNAAAATGTSLEDVAMSVGQLNRQLQSGEAPTAASDLRAMGVISEEAAEKVKLLVQSGADFATTWAVVNSALSANSGAMKKAAEDVGMFQTQLEKAQEQMAESYAEPFKEAEIATMKRAIDTAQKMEPIMRALGETFAQVSGGVTDLSGRFTNMLVSIPGASGAVDILSKAFGVLLGSMILIGSVQIVGLLKTIGVTAKGAFSSIMSLASAHKAAAVATEMNARAQLQYAAAVAAASAGQDVLAAKLFVQAAASKGAATGATALGAAGNMVRGIFGALISPIGAMIAGIVGIVAGTWSYANALKAQIKELKELRQANKDATADMNNRIAAMKTEEDRTKTLADAKQRLAESEKKLMELSDSKANPLFMGERQSKINEQADQVRRNQQAIQQIKDAGGLAQSGKREQQIRDEAIRQFQLDEANTENQISAAPNLERGILLHQRRAELERRLKEAQLYQSEQNKIEDESRKANAPEIVAARMRLNSKSFILQNEQLATDAAKRGDMKAFYGYNRTAELGKAKYGDVGGLSRSIQDIKFQQTALAKEDEATINRLTTEKELTKLREEGVLMAFRESAIRIAGLNKEIELARKAGDVRLEQDLQNKKLQEQQQNELKLRDIRRSVDQYRRDTDIMQLEGTRGAGRTDALKKATTLKDLDSFINSYRDLYDSTGDAKLSRQLATARTKAQIGLSRDSAPIADSMQAIGGGGEVTNTKSLLTVAERQTKILESIEKLLGKEDKKAKPQGFAP